MIDPGAFEPGWASPPGDTIREILAKRSISASEFAEEMGMSAEWVAALTVGEVRIDEALAEHLHRVLGVPEAFWLNREQQYRDAAFAHELTARDWVKSLPTADMARFGWIRPSSTLQGKIEECLRFFGVATVRAWKEQYRRELSVAAFRTSPAFAPNPAAVSAWLRWAALKAGEIKCGPWDRTKFEAAIPSLRHLCRQKEPAKFLPELRRLCAECGVAVVIAPAPKGCRASGATRFLSEHKALIVLSFRYRSDDHFWFTFFHEAAHLILHPMAALFLEDDSDATSVEEEEADEFAMNVLLPPPQRAHLSRLPLRVYAISRFARDVGVSAGIVVGQLQHSGRLRHDRLNGLKRRYEWRSYQDAPASQ